MRKHWQTAAWRKQTAKIVRLYRKGHTGKEIRRAFDYRLSLREIKARLDDVDTNVWCTLYNLKERAEQEREKADWNRFISTATGFEREGVEYEWDDKVHGNLPTGFTGREPASQAWGYSLLRWIDHPAKGMAPNIAYCRGL